MRIFNQTPSFWRDRLHASAMHLLISVLVAAVAGLLVFGVWYPYPYRDISGGRELFWLVVTVDVILGPAVTLAVFDRRKSWSELRRDMLAIAVLQIAALGYGMWTVCVARPVHLVFEYDRFRIVHAIDVPPELLPKTPSDIDALPLTGPNLLALRPFKSNKEKMDATMAALQGVSLASRPDLWQPYRQSAPEILKLAKPATELKDRFPNRADEIERVLANAGLKSQGVLYLPLVGRNSFWTVFIDSADAKIVATMPLDPF
nr:TfpX/TfpZ family type IV pilin accessory protein [uncultured Rhodoferax sp.]